MTPTCACGPCTSPAAADPSSAVAHSLAHLCKKENLERALQLVENGHVHRLVAEPSGRTLFQVLTESRPYVVVLSMANLRPSQAPRGRRCKAKSVETPICVCCRTTARASTSSTRLSSATRGSMCALCPPALCVH